MNELVKDDPAAQSWKDAVRDLSVRIHRDYAERVAPFGRGIDIWGNSTTIELGVRLGGRVGPMWGHQIRYAKRTGPLGLFGPRVIIKDFAAVERELRSAIDAWLIEHERRRSE